MPGRLRRPGHRRRLRPAHDVKTERGHPSRGNAPQESLARAAGDRGLTAPRASLIIPVYNQLQYTKGCLDSILADNDRQPYEIIIVDNASADGTQDYLNALARDLERT